MRDLLHDHRGVTRLGLLITVLLLLVAGSIGWWTYSNNKNGESKGANKTRQDVVKQATCSYDDHGLCKFFTSLKTVEYYTVYANSKTNGRSSTAILKSAKPDKYYLKVSGATSYETITIGNSLYTKAGDTWYKQTIPAVDINKYQGGNNITLTEPDNKSNGTKVTYRKIAQEKCGDLTCLKYQAIDPRDSTNTTFIWFDTRDYQLRRTQKISAGTGSYAYTATYNYDRVSISEPAGAKVLGASQTLTPGQTQPTDLPHTGDDPPTPEELEQYRIMTLR